MALGPEEVHDLAVHHRIALSRYSNTIVRRVLALSNRVEKSILERLASADLTDFGRLRLEQTLAELRTIQARGWGVISDRLLADLDALAGNEMAFGQQLAKASGALEVQMFTGAPSLAQVVAAARARPFSGRILKDWLKDAEEGQARKVREVIRQGVVEGQTIDQMIRAIRGTKAAQYQDGALQVSRRGAEAMVRTAVTHVSNVAQQEVFAAHADVVKAWEFCATLDGRTTLLCASLHGKTFPLGKGPVPPRHVACRSIALPVIDDIPGVKPYTLPTYDAWLKRQPVAVQDEILGVMKGQLFRKGGMTIDRFTDQAGRVLTLNQLRARDAAAFKAAGI